MKTFRFISVLLLTAGVVISSCSKESIEPEQEPVSNVKTYKVSVKSNNGVDTKATLEESGTTLSFTWNTGDKLTVYNQTTGRDITGTLAAKSSGKTTRFEGELSGDIEEGNTLVLSYLSPSYNAQDGTLNGIANSCDYAVATVTVTSINGSDISTTDATFDLQQAFVKFTLKDKASGNNLVPTSLTIKVNGMSDIAVTPANTSSNVVYVALAGVTNKDITLTAVAGGKIYTYRKTGVTFDHKKYYTITVKMSESEEIGNPLTLEAKDANVKVTFNNHASGKVSYNKNNGEETGDIAAGDSKEITLTNIGDKVSFFGDNDSYNSTSAAISCDGGDCYVYGNIMSLVNSTDYASETTISETSCFSHFFNNNTHIVNHSQRELVLPATTLANMSYYHMFYGCTGLTSAPALPATTLGNSCYGYMFAGCRGLTTAPALPATTLANSCYTHMFERCIGLTVAPNLPATTLADNCYNSMFYNCESLTKAPALPATELAPACYSHMFQNSYFLTTPPDLPATTLTEKCYEYMFYGCLELIKAPELPAAELATGCYRCMFYGCSALSYVKCLATDISASGCVNNWLKNVPLGGTFVKDASATWPNGVNGIPQGWTVEDAS
ncbi:MAG: hypothetical protein IKS82_06895 [Bacteroidales bacterium]|nr:hypothetical protein [Bacteroidales bacterium]